MTTIKEARFVFPVLVFQANGVIYAVLDSEELTICDVPALKKGGRTGMELVDANGKCWKVLRTHKIGIHRYWLFLPVLARIDYDLERLPDVPLATLKERLLPEIRNGATHYFDWRVEDEAIPALEAQLAAATNVPDLCRILEVGYP